MLFIRLLCSLPTMVCDTVSNIVRQVAMLPFFTGNLHCCASGHSAPFLQQWGHSQLTLLTACSNFISIYPNLFEFLLNLFEFYGIFQESMWKKLLGQFWVSSHHPMFGLMYILDKVFIQASSLACEVCVKVSPLCFLPTTVYKTANSVVCQVAMLPSFNSLWG